jgi:hypothetical protein
LSGHIVQFIFRLFQLLDGVLNLWLFEELLYFLVQFVDVFRGQLFDCRLPCHFRPQLVDFADHVSELTHRRRVEYLATAKVYFPQFFLNSPVYFYPFGCIFGDEPIGPDVTLSRPHRLLLHLAFPNAQVSQRILSRRSGELRS